MTTKTKIDYPNVESLRKNGYKVRVYHGRIFYNGHHKGCKYQLQYIASKKEVMQWEDGRDYILSCKGGFTIVEIRTLNGAELKGKYNTPTGKQFDRKLGLKVAINRALINGA
jgi:hypothetical protein